MSIETEAALLTRLRKEYEAKGYTFEPGRPLETPDGSEARPDFMARKSGRTELIALRPYGSEERDEPRVRALSELAAALEGWSFRLFLVEGPETALPEPPGKEEIAAMLDRARALQSGGDGALALVAAWSALEAAARRVLSQHGQRPKLFPGSSLVRELIAHGYLGQDHLTRFHNLARQSELAAHGFFTRPPEESGTNAVIALAEELIDGNVRELGIAALNRRAGTAGSAPRR